MNRFPVGRAIAHAYGFLFAQFFTVVTLSWVAALLYAVLRLAVLPTALPAHALENPLVAALHGACAVAGVLLLSAIAVSLTRAALGEHKAWQLAHFTIGARELKLFAALIRLYVAIALTVALCVGAVIGTSLGAKALVAHWPAAAQTGWPVEQIAVIAVTVIVALVAIYVALRASFLLFPVAAVEDKASILRAWKLGRGNVLRMACVMLAVLLPAYLLVVVAEYALFGPALVDAVRAAFETQSPDSAKLVALLAGHVLGISILSAATLVVLTALAAGASSSAYAVLTGRESAAPAEVVEAVAAHDDHGHDAHGHAAHGHDDHGHDDHGHDDHGHAAHGHDDHGHDDHGHAAHGHDDHGHDDHGHAAHGHEEHAEAGHGAHGHDEHAHGHDDHGHDTHGHDDHGHGAGAHDQHAHAGDDHGHDDHGHGEHAHEEHGHDGHGHGDHGHDDHGHDGHGDDHHHHAAAALAPEVMELDAPLDDATHKARELEHA